MNVVPIPSSLEKRVAAPHKTTSHRDVGTLSFLEKSFFELRIGEMEYWIASGVVKEAMDGHSRSKRPYKTSLLNFLSLSLADYQWLTSENFHRLNAILDYLWNNGAQEVREMHEIWLSRLAPYDLADTLLNVGAHPGRDPLKTHPNTKPRNSNWVSALEQSLRFIYTHERAHTLRKTPIDFSLIHAWTSRVKRFLTVGGHDDGVMARALGILYQLASLNPGNSEWSEMRDTLLKQGATASVHNNGVLSGIFHNAPTNPVTSTNIYYIMKEWRENNGHSDVVFSDDTLNDILEKELHRRNQAWTDCTTSWIETLSTITGPDGQTALSRRTPISTQTTQEEFERVLLNGTDDVHLWKALLDAPNGTVIATQLSRGLSQGKKTLPWTHASDDKWWHRRDENAKILTTINQRLSARRLYALVKIINDPIVSQNVDPQWCNTLATNMLPFESLGDNRQDPAPSEIYCHEKPSGMMNPVNLSWIPKRLPSTEELHGLLQLAPPALRQTVEQTYWLDNLLPQITTLWDKNNTDEATRFSYLRLLHSYGALLDKEKKPSPWWSLKDPSTRYTNQSRNYGIAFMATCAPIDRNNNLLQT